MQQSHDYKAYPTSLQAILIVYVGRSKNTKTLMLLICHSNCVHNNDVYSNVYNNDVHNNDVHSNDVHNNDVHNNDVYNNDVYRCRYCVRRYYSRLP